MSHPNTEQYFAINKNDIQGVLHPILQLTYDPVFKGCFRIHNGTSRAVEVLRQMLHVDNIIQVNTVVTSQNAIINNVDHQKEATKNINLFKKQFLKELNRSYLWMRRKRSTYEEVFMFSVFVSNFEDGRWCTHSITILLRILANGDNVKRGTVGQSPSALSRYSGSVMMTFIDPHGSYDVSSYKWVMKSDDVVQLTLRKFCDEHNLFYATSSPSKNNKLFFGIQWMLAGPYCMMYNYFLIYTFMTQTSEDPIHNAFVKPYNGLHVNIKNKNVTYKPVLPNRKDYATGTGRNNEMINMFKDGLLQTYNRVFTGERKLPNREIPWEEKRVRYVTLIYGAIVELVEPADIAQRKIMWPDFPYLKKDGTSKVNIAIGVLLFLADYIMVCGAILVTHTFRTIAVRIRYKSARLRQRAQNTRTNKSALNTTVPNKASKNSKELRDNKNKNTRTSKSKKRVRSPSPQSRAGRSRSPDRPPSSRAPSSAPSAQRERNNAGANRSSPLRKKTKSV